MENQRIAPRDEIDTSTLRHILQDCKSIAVLGLHPEKTKAAYYVPEYLYRQGYSIFAVNPKLERRTQIFGHLPVAQLAELGHAVDVVQIFRRSEAVPEHLPEIFGMSPLPKVVWMQQGVSHAEAAEQLRARGIQVVQDRCMLSDHRSLL